MEWWWVGERDPQQNDCNQRSFPPISLIFFWLKAQRSLQAKWKMEAGGKWKTGAGWQKISIPCPAEIPVALPRPSSRASAPSPLRFLFSGAASWLSLLLCFCTAEDHGRARVGELKPQPVLEQLLPDHRDLDIDSSLCQRPNSIYFCLT